MVINTDNLVSITEANQNFSRVARMVDENGAAVILKNNVPRYVLMEFSQVEDEQQAKDEDILEISKRLIAITPLEFGARFSAFSRISIPPISSFNAENASLELLFA